MPPRRVAVTGIGAICASGYTAEEMWQALREGRSDICPIRAVDTANLKFKNGGEVRGYNATEYFPGGREDHLDRFAQFAVIAAREAVTNSAIEFTPELRERTAIVCGSCVGGQTTQDSGFVDLYLERRPRVHPLLIPKIMANAGTSHIAMEFDITGPAYTISTACSSANHAIGQAFHMVRSGAVDLAITGGSEAPFSMGSLKAWEALRVIAPDTCRPFSRDRKGMILGEGAAILILEPLDSARSRGAKIYGEIVGFGMSSDAHHLTLATSDGPARAMRAALRDAAIAPEQIGYINAHGTGTPANDPTETRAIREVFGKIAAAAVSQFDKIDARARAGSGRRIGGCRDSTGAARWHPAAHR